MLQQGASAQVRYRGACLFSARAAAAANMRDCLRFESPPKLSSGTSNNVLVSPFPPNTGCWHTRSLVFSQLGSFLPERSPLPTRHSLRASPGSGSSDLPEHRTAERDSTASWQPELVRNPLRIAKRPAHRSVVPLESFDCAPPDAPGAAALDFRVVAPPGLQKSEPTGQKRSCEPAPRGRVAR